MHRGLAGDYLYEIEQVPGAMSDFAREEELPFLALLAFSNVWTVPMKLTGRRSCRAPLETSKPPHLYPADLAVSPLNPVLMR
jgi:hypothetical protein